MKRLALISILLTLAFGASAQTKSEADLVLDLFVPQCSSGKLKSEPFTGTLPGSMTGELFSFESEDKSCHFDAVRVKTVDGRYYVGNPWPIAGMAGTPAEKIRRIAWEALQLSVVDETGATEFGLQKVRVTQVTEAGHVVVEGMVDPAGIMYFPGEFAKNATEMKAKLESRLAPIAAAAPTRGPKDAPVTIVEFSDFQCPSCRMASEQFEPFFEKHAGKIRYVRIDMPIVSSHPWAFPAALIGRAIWTQSPDAFWKYKKAVYASQSDLNAFTIDQFGRSFAEDHGLDLKRFDADLAAEPTRKAVLDGLGTAFTMQVAATPTYFVNGKIVSTGVESANLKGHIEKLLASK